MAKEMHTYKNVKVPTKAKEIIDEMAKQHEKKHGTKPRKADFWLDAVKLFKEFSE